MKGALVPLTLAFQIRASYAYLPPSPRAQPKFKAQMNEEAANTIDLLRAKLMPRPNKMENAENFMTANSVPPRSWIGAVLQVAKASKARRLSSTQAQRLSSTQGARLRRLSTKGARDGSMVLAGRSSMVAKRKLYWIMTLAGLALIMATADRTIFSVAVVHIKKELNLTATGVASAMSAMLYPYIFTNLPGGALADEIGGMKVMLIALSIFSVCVASMPIALAYLKPPVVALDAMRALFGFSQGPAFPSSFSVISQWLPAKARSTGMGLLYASFSVGNAVGFLLGGLIPKLGWRAVFYIAGGFGVLLSLLGLTLIGQQPAGTVAFARTYTGLPQVGSSSSARWSEFKLFLSWRVVGQIAVMMYCHSVINWVFFLIENWLPTYFSKVLGVDLGKSALLSALPWFILSLFSASAGKIGDVMLKHGWKTVRIRKFLFGLSSLIPAASWVCLGFTKNVYLASVILAIALASYGTCNGGLHSHIQDVAAGRTGKIIGLINTIGIIVATVEQYIIAYMMKKTGSFKSIFDLTAVLQVISFGLFLGFIQEHKLFPDLPGR